MPNNNDNTSFWNDPWNTSPMEQPEYDPANGNNTGLNNELMDEGLMSSSGEPTGVGSGIDEGLRIIWGPKKIPDVIPPDPDVVPEPPDPSIPPIDLIDDNPDTVATEARPSYVTKTWICEESISITATWLGDTNLYARTMPAASGDVLLGWYQSDTNCNKVTYTKKYTTGTNGLNKLYAASDASFTTAPDTGTYPCPCADDPLTDTGTDESGLTDCQAYLTTACSGADTYKEAYAGAPDYDTLLTNIFNISCDAGYNQVGDISYCTPITYAEEYWTASFGLCCDENPIPPIPAGACGAVRIQISGECWVGASHYSQFDNTSHTIEISADTWIDIFGADYYRYTYPNGDYIQIKLVSSQGYIRPRLIMSGATLITNNNVSTGFPSSGTSVQELEINSGTVYSGPDASYPKTTATIGWVFIYSYGEWGSCRP